MTTPTGPDLAQVIRRAAVRATLAPSVHNTQPWRFTLGPGTLEVFADWTRQLRLLDPRGRQMLISCGCAVFNARVSIAAAGYTARVEPFPDPARPTLVARLTVTEARADDLPIGELDGLIEARHSNRGAFADEPVPDEVIAALVEAARAERVELFPIIKPEHRAATARLTAAANGLEQEDPRYRAELQAWTSADPGRLDGLAQATRWPPLDSDVGGHAGANDGLLVLGSHHDTPLAWLGVGQALEHVLLEVTRRGYAATPLTQLIEVAATNRPFRKALGLAMHPQLLVRIGRARSTGGSRRRRLADMLKESA
jgi:hypothetical protein